MSRSAWRTRQHYVKLQERLTSCYRYNADGQRYHKQAVPYKSAPGPAQYYALDGSATVGFFPMSGTSYWTISTPSGEVVGRMTTSGSASYYIKDHLGSVRVVVNASGSVLETRDYYPFTPLRSVSRPSALCGLEMPGRSYLSGTKAKENFTGHELDAESGMLYAGARFYMPNIGRFTSADPHAANYPHLAPYVYATNNPLLYIDPDGKDYVLHFNKEDKRVTVGATFYTNEAGAESARAAVSYWNEQSGAQTFTVEGVEYKVDFSLDVVVGEFEAGPGSNSWVVVDDGKLGENILGGLAGGNQVFVTKRGATDVRVGAHEIGHALGMRHSAGSIMNADVGGVVSATVYANMYDMIQNPVLHRHLSREQRRARANPEINRAGRRVRMGLGTISPGTLP